jgi:hypothetical protein
MLAHTPLDERRGFRLQKNKEIFWGRRIDCGTIDKISPIQVKNEKKWQVTKIFSVAR